MADKPYQQTGDYIPRKDAAFLAWGEGFARGVAQHYEHLGLTQQDVDWIELWTGRFADAYQPTQSAESRTTALVKAKNEMRKQVEAIYRSYAQRIKHHPGVSNQDLIGLGIHVDDATKTPIGTPRSAPILRRMMSKSGGHILRYADENSPFLNRKPYGMWVIQIYANVDDAYNPNPDTARHVGDYGRQPIRINWSAKLTGKTVTYFGRWVTRKGLKGPWSGPVFISVASGGNAASPELPLKHAA